MSREPRTTPADAPGLRSGSGRRRHGPAAADLAAGAQRDADRSAAASAPARARRHRRIAARCCSSTTRATARCRRRRASASTSCGPTPGCPAPDEAALVVATRSRAALPTLVADADRQMPDLAARLDTPRGAAPAARARRRARRAAGDRLRRRRRRRRASTATSSKSADAFMTALELFRLRQSEELQRDLRALLDEFAASLSATLNLPAGLDIFCHGANRLFGADRTSVWIHDRRARHLVLQASSDPGRRRARRPRQRRRSRSAPAAVAMRSTRAEIIRRRRRRRRPRTVTVPLRGTPARARHDRLRRRARRDRAASSICSIAPTSSGASCRAPSRTCSCSTT